MSNLSSKNEADHPKNAMVCGLMVVCLEIISVNYNMLAVIPQLSLGVAPGTFTMFLPALVCLFVTFRN